MCPAVSETGNLLLDKGPAICYNVYAHIVLFPAKRAVYSIGA
jgi:hypothetical protein